MIKRMAILITIISIIFAACGAETNKSKEQTKNIVAKKTVSVESKKPKEMDVDFKKLKEVDGIYYFENDTKPYTGKSIKYYTAGKVKEINYFKDGKRDGESISYYSVVDLDAKKDDKKNTETSLQYGKIQGKENHKNGIQDGEFVWYYENGNICAKGNYKNGNLDGDSITYSENGDIVSKFTYKDGELVE